MEIGDLVGVIAAIRLDQDDHMTEAQAVRNGYLVEREKKYVIGIGYQLPTPLDSRAEMK